MTDTLAIHKDGTIRLGLIQAPTVREFEEQALHLCFDGLQSKNKQLYLTQLPVHNREKSKPSLVFMLQESPCTSSKLPGGSRTQIGPNDPKCGRDFWPLDDTLLLNYPTPPKDPLIGMLEPLRAQYFGTWEASYLQS